MSLRNLVKKAFIGTLAGIGAGHGQANAPILGGLGGFAGDTIGIPLGMTLGGLLGHKLGGPAGALIGMPLGSIAGSATLGHILGGAAARTFNPQGVKERAILEHLARTQPGQPQTMNAGEMPKQAAVKKALMEKLAMLPQEQDMMMEFYKSHPSTYGYVTHPSTGVMPGVGGAALGAGAGAILSRLIASKNPLLNYGIPIAGGALGGLLGGTGHLFRHDDPAKMQQAMESGVLPREVPHQAIQNHLQRQQLEAANHANTMHMLNYLKD